MRMRSRSGNSRLAGVDIFNDLNSNRSLQLPKAMPAQGVASRDVRARAPDRVSVSDNRAQPGAAGTAPFRERSQPAAENLAGASKVRKNEDSHSGVPKGRGECMGCECTRWTDAVVNGGRRRLGVGRRTTARPGPLQERKTTPSEVARAAQLAARRGELYSGLVAQSDPSPPAQRQAANRSSATAAARFLPTRITCLAHRTCPLRLLPLAGAPRSSICPWRRPLALRSLPPLPILLWTVPRPHGSFRVSGACVQSALPDGHPVSGGRWPGGQVAPLGVPEALWQALGGVIDERQRAVLQLQVQRQPLLLVVATPSAEVACERMLRHWRDTGQCLWSESPADGFSGAACWTSRLARQFGYVRAQRDDATAAVAAAATAGGARRTRGGRARGAAGYRHPRQRVCHHRPAVALVLSARSVVYEELAWHRLRGADLCVRRVRLRGRARRGRPPMAAARCPAADGVRRWCVSSPSPGAGGSGCGARCTDGDGHDAELERQGRGCQGGRRRVAGTRPDVGRAGRALGAGIPSCAQSVALLVHPRWQQTARGCGLLWPRRSADATGLSVLLCRGPAAFHRRPTDHGRRAHAGTDLLSGRGVRFQGRQERAASRIRAGSVWRVHAAGARSAAPGGVGCPGRRPRRVSVARRCGCRRALMFLLGDVRICRREWSEAASLFARYAVAGAAATSGATSPRRWQALPSHVHRALFYECAADCLRQPGATRRPRKAAFLRLKAAEQYNAAGLPLFALRSVSLAMSVYGRGQWSGIIGQLLLRRAQAFEACERHDKAHHTYCALLAGAHLSMADERAALTSAAVCAAQRGRPEWDGSAPPPPPWIDVPSVRLVVGDDIGTDDDAAEWHALEQRLQHWTQSHSHSAALEGASEHPVSADGPRVDVSVEAPGDSAHCAAGEPLWIEFRAWNRLHSPIELRHLQARFVCTNSLGEALSAAAPVDITAEWVTGVSEGGGIFRVRARAQSPPAGTYRLHRLQWALHCASTTPSLIGCGGVEIHRQGKRRNRTREERARQTPLREPDRTLLLRVCDDIPAMRVALPAFPAWMPAGLVWQGTLTLENTSRHRIERVAFVCSDRQRMLLCVGDAEAGRSASQGEPVACGGGWLPLVSADGPRSRESATNARCRWRERQRGGGAGGVGGGARRHSAVRVHR
eukprot:ctg_68.g64